MLLKTPEVNSKPESCMLCVARVKTRQVGQIYSKSHHQGHLEQGAHTQPAYGGPRTSQPVRGLMLTSAFTESNARKRKQVTKRKAWDVEEGTKGGN